MSQYLEAGEKRRSQQRDHAEVAGWDQGRGNEWKIKNYGIC